MLETREFRQVSSDAFKSWSRCKKQYYYKYVKRLQWPADTRHFSLGRDVHKLLDYQARGLNCEGLLANASPEVRLIWQKLMAHPVSQLPVVANEWAFHVPVQLAFGETEWLTGRLDRVARRDNCVVIIDWKTGTGIPKNPELDWQTLLYLYALLETAPSFSAQDLQLNQAGPLQAKQLQFIYVEIKPDQSTPIREVVIPYTQEKHEHTGALLKSILQHMNHEEDYPLPENCPDRFCPYVSICGI